MSSLPSYFLNFLKSTTYLLHISWNSATCLLHICCTKVHVVVFHSLLYRLHLWHARVFYEGSWATLSFKNLSEDRFSSLWNLRLEAGQLLRRYTLYRLHLWTSLRVNEPTEFPKPQRQRSEDRFNYETSD